LHSITKCHLHLDLHSLKGPSKISSKLNNGVFVVLYQMSYKYIVLSFLVDQTASQFKA